MTELILTVNHQKFSLNVPESRTLAEVLRLDLGLTGTKIGCEEAECGICTVLIDGIPVDSCLFPAFKAYGKHILTIEGLAQNGHLHPVQDNFIKHGAVQCGFCSPGLIMTSVALIDACPEPTDSDIKTALKDTYCRCTGYSSVIQAIKSAASEMRGEAALSVNEPAAEDTERVVGKSVPPYEVREKVTGKARYTDDYVFPNMLFARTLRSRYPHARLINIDTSAAEKLEGVYAVLTHKDVSGENLHGLVRRDWPVLCEDKVRYVGDAIAIVAADTAEIAAQAIALIDVEYDPLPVVSDPEYAHDSNAPHVHPGGNLLKHIKVRHGDIETGFAEADFIVEREYRTPIVEHAFLEPECAIGVPEGVEGHDKLTVYVGSQIPYQDREQIARAMGIEQDKIRVRGTLIGGGFGGKEDIAGQIHVAMLTRVTGRPVKMLYTRQESLIFHPKRHATIIRIKTGAKQTGELVAVQAELYGDAGAYASLSDKVMTRATTHATGPYVVPHAKIDCYAMYTNNPPAGAFRGFGVTQSAFAVEQNMDILAELIGIDPVEFRRRNAHRVGSITATGQELRESVGLVQTLDHVYDDMQHNGTFQWAWRDGHKAYGWGVGSAYKNTGLGGGAPDKAIAEVEAFEDGSVEVRTSSADMGQGLAHVLAQCVAEEFTLPYERVKVLLSDTDLTPDGGPTTASRQTFVSGNAARLAASTLREAFTRTAAEHLDYPPSELRYEEGLLHYNGDHVEFGDIVRWMKASGIMPKARHEYWAPQTKPLGEGGDMHFAFSYATQAALVEVDMETGEVHVLKVVSSTDVGRAINPLSLQGQIEGGIVMALGNTLSEAFIVEDGIPWTSTLSRYKMPSIKHTPEIITRLVEDRVSSGPYGAKGVGEIPSICTAPAISNAVYNATGVRIYSIPIDQDALLRAIKNGHTEVHTTWSDVR